MKLLALEVPVRGVHDEKFTQALLREEAARAWELYSQGMIREFYFRDDREEAVLVLECRSVAAARKVLTTLPLVRKGLIDFEIIPLRPYPGLSRLFASERTQQKDRTPSVGRPTFP